MYDYIQFSSGGGGGEGILRGILCRKEGRGGAVGFNIILSQRGEPILHPTSREGVLLFFFCLFMLTCFPLPRSAVPKSAVISDGLFF